MKKTKFASFAIILAAMAVCVGQEAPNPNRLTDSQKDALEKARKTVEGETKTKTVTATMKLAAIAKDLDRNILAAQPDPDVERKLQSDLVQMVTEMVTTVLQAKIAADREVVKILTPEQKKILLAELDKAGSNPDLAELIGKLFVDKK
jgi:hypothetical protein